MLCVAWQISPEYLIIIICTPLPLSMAFIFSSKFLHFVSSSLHMLANTAGDTWHSPAQIIAACTHVATRQHFSHIHFTGITTAIPQNKLDTNDNDKELIGWLRNVPLNTLKVLSGTIQYRAVLIIFPLNLQTITITRMLSSGREWEIKSWYNEVCHPCLQQLVVEVRWTDNSEVPWSVQSSGSKNNIQPSKTSSKILFSFETIHRESIKTCHSTFKHNFGVCWQIFKILSPLDSARNLQ